MKKIDTSINAIKKHIKSKTNNNPDVIFKSLTFMNNKINVIFCESLSNRDIINKFILEYFEEKNTEQKNIKDMLTFLEENIPTHKTTPLNNYDELFYNLFSGFTLISIDGYDKVLSIETKATLNSSISTAQNESTIKGPKDAFTESYQTNLGLIRKRIKTENLWLDELKIGKQSKTKIGIMYINGIVSNKLVKEIKDKISKINIDAVMDSNYIIEAITENKNNVFPNFISTERPDLVAMKLLDGRVAVIVENTQYVVIVPITFNELFQSPEDYYQKPINVNYTRIIRFIALFLTLLTPALYIAITTYNYEAIPGKILINFATQRDGVPFPTVLEALLMTLTFEILKETDTRVPSSIGSSLSIVGALVLGQAAVEAGIVSPIMVIVIAITSISGLMISYLDTTNGIRWWRLIFMFSASIVGIIGIVIAGIMFLINITSIKSFGLPYLSPVAPFNRKNLGDTLLLNNKNRLFKRNSLTAAKNQTKGKEETKNE
ncbi:MAG: spore germination protein [Bacilli bacterium]|nr:spore germination protein [Bacilli bacterium]MDD3304888.1 spore germination protein [Bacilli bacterium]MDD4053512.1 spore germination protein [Bacilli bacterium]MDD4411547.1 spore germination protein [Bacilli bacterium]